MEQVCLAISAVISDVDAIEAQLASIDTRSIVEQCIPRALQTLLDLPTVPDARGTLDLLKDIWGVRTIYQPIVRPPSPYIPTDIGSEEIKRFLLERAPTAEYKQPTIPFLGLPTGSTITEEKKFEFKRPIPTIAEEKKFEFKRPIPTITEERKHESKHPSLQEIVGIGGPRVIASSDLGCTYRPPLPCSNTQLNSKYNSDQYVMQISSIAPSKNQLIIEQRLLQVDPDQKYFINILDCCSNLTAYPDLEQCRLTFGVSVSACYSLYGGIDLYTYQLEVSESERSGLSTQSYIEACSQLLQALALMHDVAQIAHGNINDKNVLIDDYEENFRICNFIAARDISTMDQKQAIQLRQADNLALAQVLYDLADSVVIETEDDQAIVDAYRAQFS